MTFLYNIAQQMFVFHYVSGEYEREQMLYLLFIYLLPQFVFFYRGWDYSRLHFFGCSIFKEKLISWGVFTPGSFGEDVSKT